MRSCQRSHLTLIKQNSVTAISSPFATKVLRAQKSRLVDASQAQMRAPDRIGNVRLSSKPKSVIISIPPHLSCLQIGKNLPIASTTAPPAPTTTAVNKKPIVPPPPCSRIAHRPCDPSCQNPRQMHAPVTVAAMNPARLFLGANLIAFTPGRCGGRGGV